MGNIMKKLFFALLLSLVVTSVSTFTIKAMEKERKNVLCGNNDFYSIILPGQNGLGGEDYERNSVVNAPCKRYETLLSSWQIDLGQENCIRHFEKQLEADENAKNTDRMMLHGISKGCATVLNATARMTKKKQAKVKCITLEAVLGSGNNAINHTAKMVSGPIINIPGVKSVLPWIAKIFFPSYNPSGKQALSSAQDLSTDITFVIIHSENDLQLPINDARELYLKLLEQENNNTYLIESPMCAHFNILDYDPERRNKIKAIQAIYRNHNLPYNKNILQNDEQPDIKKFQPSSDDVKERIKNTEQSG